MSTSAALKAKSYDIARDAYMDRLVSFNKIRNQFAVLSTANPFRGLGPNTCPHMMGGTDFYRTDVNVDIAAKWITTEQLRILCDVYTPLYTKAQLLLIAGLDWDQRNATL